jgi:hypothetical protein
MYNNFQLQFTFASSMGRQRRKLEFSYFTSDHVTHTGYVVTSHSRDNERDVDLSEPVPFLKCLYQP